MKKPWIFAPIARANSSQQHRCVSSSMGGKIYFHSCWMTSFIAGALSHTEYYYEEAKKTKKTVRRLRRRCVVAYRFLPQRVYSANKGEGCVKIGFSLPWSSRMLYWRGFWCANNGWNLWILRKDDFSLSSKRGNINYVWLLWSLGQALKHSSKFPALTLNPIHGRTQVFCVCSN